VDGVPDTAIPVDPVYGGILPPEVLSRLTASATRALVGRLVRGGDISPDLLKLVDGLLARIAGSAVSLFQLYLYRSRASEWPAQAPSPELRSCVSAEWPRVLKR
jgi:hypothetical protein